MVAHWTQLTWALYSLSYMVLGVAVASRAAAFPSSTLRNRLLCLAASSLLHAVYDGTILANDLSGGWLPGKLRYCIESLSFFPLCYFATGWHGPRARMLKIAIALTAVASLGVVLGADDPRYLQMVVHFGIGIPAGLFAAYALARDPVFRPTPNASELALKVAALSLVGYSVTQFILIPGPYFPASVFNSENFTALFGVSPFSVRVVLAAIFTVATLALLNRFDDAMRLEAAKRVEQTRRALRVSEAKLADIFRMSPEGIIVTDAEGRIEMFSAGAEAIFGYRADEMMGQNAACLIPERFRAGHRVQLREFLLSAPMNQLRGSIPEGVGLRKNGDEFPLDASMSKISTPEGMLVTTILRDISLQKAEAEELMNAKRVAEEASRAKSRFIANMSHELRTPLNAILGFSELLRSDTFHSHRTEYAKLIHGAGMHLLSLVDDILDLAKIDAGKLTLREKRVDFVTLSRAVLDLLQEKANSNGVALSFDAANNLPDIHGDERALRQILLNLASNGLKFTPPGGKVSVFARVELNGEFVFGVRDTGIGIPDEDQASVFDSFGQGRPDAVTGDKGTGLGLPIAKGLTHAHGGKIEIFSRQGEGTCVTVTLPAERVRMTGTRIAAA